jgi:hypothetical protein
VFTEVSSLVRSLGGQGAFKFSGAGGLGGGALTTSGDASMDLSTADSLGF